MTKNDLLKMGLNEDQSKKISDAYKNALNGYVPKTRLDEVINERNALRIYIGEQDKKLVKLEQEMTANQELQQQICYLQKDNSVMKDKLEQAKNSLKLAIEMTL
ncbi:minor structural protein GP20 [Lachnotalea glycerini]|uniref:Minor structural protein GP20 n=1 Tax=Lachnotalea glycerini TaxID=1763509 RepID=A0A255IFI0_9FIRM|nr:phage scaffolding protein [Lachnotalea glycerini]PXV85404.1 minor structural protein GP20 [Lachnotalea glycerini]RDY30368.1 hypothetical protein CG710_015015 [Lachnotalea glycerini]